MSPYVLHLDYATFAFTRDSVNLEKYSVLFLVVLTSVFVSSAFRKTPPCSLPMDFITSLNAALSKIRMFYMSPALVVSISVRLCLV